MATKPPKKNTASLNVIVTSDETEERTFARTLLRPTVQAAVSLQKLGTVTTESQESDLSVLVEELNDQVQAVRGGNVDRSQAMLFAQAQTLDSIFHALLRRGVNNLGHYPETADRYIRLALKAQSQCRTTLEAVIDIKQPKVGYVAQQNIAQTQQVNNYVENQDGERLDSGTQEEAVRTDQELEAVGAINRTEDR